MNPMDLPNGISPREELESRVIAMLLGEADEFEKTELDAILSKDSGLQAFHDEMAQSIDVVGEAAVSIGPVGAPGGPKLSPSRRHEIEQAWSGGGTASAKTATTLAGSLAKMHPLIPLAVAAGVGLAAGTALVNFDSGDTSRTNHAEAPAAPSQNGQVTSSQSESTELYPDLPRRSVYDIPEGASRPEAGVGPEGSPADAGQDLAAGQKLLERELRNLPADASVPDVFTEAERRENLIELARRNRDFTFDSEGLSGESGSISGGSLSGHPGVFAFGPPNALALGDLGQPSPVPNAPTGKDSAFPRSVTGFASAISLPEANGDIDRELLARHVTVARFNGLPFRTCRGLTGRCPRDCGGSGEFASFSIEKYLEYDKTGKYGSSKQTSHLIQISDFSREPMGDPVTLKVIAELKQGDYVMLSWDHERMTRKGSSSPNRPIQEIRKLTEAEQKQYFPDPR